MIECRIHRYLRCKRKVLYNKKKLQRRTKWIGKVINDALTIFSAIVSDYSSQVVLPSPSQGRHHRARGSCYNGRRVQSCTEQEPRRHSCTLDSIRPRHSSSTSSEFVPYVSYQQEYLTRIHKLRPQDGLLAFSI